MNPGLPNTVHRTRELKAHALSLGFDAVAVCPAVPAHGFDRFREWLSRGYAGRMRYLEDRQAAYQHPRYVLSGVRSVLMLAMNYRTSRPRDPRAGQGRISRYAWGSADYHDVIHSRLRALAQFARVQCAARRVRGVVDTAPLFERELAQLAGLGWIGKHALLLNRKAGSWFFLAALLTDIELEYDSPHDQDYCGTCTACLDACPTNAFPAPYVLDATRCISYLTIELREAMPAELRSRVGNWLFGCDVCQEVCPWNRQAPIAREAAFAPLPEQDPVDLEPLFAMDDAEFRRRYRRTPMWRVRRRGLLRNAAVVLGNQRSVASVPALTRGLHDADALVRSASAWALGRMDTLAARAALRERGRVETDAEVQAEIEAALRGEP